MKRITLVFLLFFSVSIIAQQGINYKAVIKDGSGVVVASTPIDVTFIILDGAVNVYEETHAPTTDANGIVILNIGEGSPVTGTFSAIDWSSTNHYLNVQIDTGGGLQDMGTTAFKTVPYALNAKTATGTITGTSSNDRVSVWSGTSSQDGSSNLTFSGSELSVVGNITLTGTVDGVDIAYHEYSTREHGATGAIVGTTNSQTLTYKTLTSTNNNVVSRGLHSATTIIDVNAATAPTTGQVLTATSATTATWQDPSTTKAYVDALITALQAQITALTPAAIGDLRVGGVVFWVDPADNTHGLVCALSDYVSDREWGCFVTDLPSVPNVTSGPVGPGAEIGDGLTNTNGILLDCPTPPAALAARSYGPEWFLPSVKELNEMYLNKAIINAIASANGGANFVNSSYWSSTEYDSMYAWKQSFSNGSQSDSNKAIRNYVRAVRAF